MNLMELLRRKAPPKSTELRAALASLSPQDELAGNVARLRNKRRDALLDGLVDADVEKIEREIAAAIREADRAKALREEIADRLARVEQLEAIDALIERKLKAEVESRDLAKAFADFGDRFQALAELVRQDRDNHAECMAIDRQLHALGSTDRVARAPRRNFGLVETHLLTWSTEAPK